VDPLSRLALSAQAGDDRALAALVEAAYDPVRRLCAGLVDPCSADDLAQEAIAAAVRSLHTYRGDSTARAWILGITRHACLDEIRARARRRRRDQHIVATGLDRTSPDASEPSVVSDLLARLDVDRRTAFILTQLLGLTYQEAAVACDCPTGTIRSRVARARSDLLTALDAIDAQAQHIGDINTA
jgi:RNA polymerase sigma-70 factor (ECF subfamily)